MNENQSNFFSNDYVSDLINYSNIQFEIFTFKNLYSTEEINKFIEFINTTKYDRKFSTNDFKNGKILNSSLSELIYDRIKHLFPKIYIDENNVKWSFVGTSKYIFYSKFKTNEMFDVHTDTGSVYDSVNNIYSKFTLLTYLNDNYIGGETIFYDNEFSETNKIIPEKNKTLIFDINLFHKGNMVIDGEKYWIGTEIVCKKIQ